MHLYRLKWPDGITAAVVLYHEGEKISSLTITGAKDRLSRLAELSTVARFDVEITALARKENAELLGRVAA